MKTQDSASANALFAVSVAIPYVICFSIGFVAGTDAPLNPFDWHWVGRAGLMIYDLVAAVVILDILAGE